MPKDFLYESGLTVTRGTTYAEEPREITYSPINGYETKRKWSLGKNEDIVSLMNELKPEGYSFVITGGPVYKIEATIPGVVLYGTETTLDPEAFSDIPDPIWEI